MLTADDVKAMAPKPLVFALANPEPEIRPELAMPHAAIVATGRSDYPNQINNVLCFPGFFRGLLDVRARRVTDVMKIEAAQAIAGVISEDELTADYIIPSVFDRRVAPAVARAVARAAVQSGVARRQPKQVVRGELRQVGWAPPTASRQLVGGAHPTVRTHSAFRRIRIPGAFRGHASLLDICVIWTRDLDLRAEGATDDLLQKRRPLPAIPALGYVQSPVCERLPCPPDQVERNPGQDQQHADSRGQGLARNHVNQERRAHRQVQRGA